MIKRILYKIIINKFFNKLFLTYSLIIIFTIGFLVYIITGSITSTLKNQAISFNKQVLETLNSYYQQKNTNMKLYLKNIINDKDLYSSIQALFNTRKEDNESDYMNLFNSIEFKLSTNATSMDPDIVNIYIYKTNTDSPFLFYNSFQQPIILNILPGLIEKIINNDNYMKTFPPLNSLDNSKDVSTYKFSTCDFLRDINNTSKILGVIVLDYKCDSLRTSYKQYSHYIKGNILVLSDSGEVIFDSSGNYYGKVYTYSNLIKTTKTDTLFLKNKIININRNNNYGYITVGEIPYADLYKDIYSLDFKIYTISLGCILAILILTYFSSIIFSKRIKSIISSIKSINNGNFDIKIATTYAEDEIGIISSNLYNMCQRIKTYIQKEYVYDIQRKEAELKQKEAELYALQSQINPHFLYNTLEVIRMKALSYRENEVSKMIRILSELFRTSIKEQMVVYVKDEINYCKDYLELYNIRYGNKLKIDFDIDTALLEYGIIKHLLQPIIENSLVHGINLDWDSNIINTIIIKGYQSDDDIIITITDNGKGMNEDKLQKVRNDLDNPTISSNKIGLSNVNYRIKLIYGKGYGLSMSSQENSGTVMTLKLKALSKEELQTYVQGLNSR